jgi:hypothetical protein
MESAEPKPPANNARVDADGSWKPQSAQPWVHPQRRQTLLQMHQQLGFEWSEHMHKYLRKGDKFTFCGFGFEWLAQCHELNSANARSIVFSFDGSPVIGVIGFNDELARYLIEMRLGGGGSIRNLSIPQSEGAAAKSDDEDVQRPPPFTRVENALLKQSLLLLLDKLGAVYSTAGLGILRPIDRAGGVKTSLGLLPDGPLIVFRYRVGDADSPLKLFIASVIDLLDMVHDTPRGNLPADDTTLLAVSTAQLEVKLIFSNFTGR